MPADRDRDRVQATQVRARVSPMRSRMLDLYEQNRNRPVDAASFFEDLKDEGWDASLSQVNYHLRKLADAQLIPTPCLER